MTSNNLHILTFQSGEVRLSCFYLQVRQRFRPCSTCRTSSRDTQCTATSPRSLVAHLNSPHNCGPAECWRLISDSFILSSSPGYIPGAGIPLQKQLEHANQQSGFTDAVRLWTCTAVQQAAAAAAALSSPHSLCADGPSPQGALRPMHPPTMHPSAPGLLATPPMAVQIPTAKVSH